MPRSIFSRLFVTLNSPYCMQSWALRYRLGLISGSGGGLFESTGLSGVFESKSHLMYFLYSSRSHTLTLVPSAFSILILSSAGLAMKPRFASMKSACSSNGSFLSTAALAVLVKSVAGFLGIIGRGVAGTVGAAGRGVAALVVTGWGAGSCAIASGATVGFVGSWANTVASLPLAVSQPSKIPQVTARSVGRVVPRFMMQPPRR